MAIKQAEQNNENAGRRGRRNRDENRDQRAAETRDEPEFIEKLVGINRVAKTVKGGRNFRFAALVIVGDGKGRVGMGTSKAREVPDAIRKATDQAKRKLMRVPMREGRTLHHDLQGHFGASLVKLRAAPAGTGIIAGGAMRAVFEALGISDVVSKSIGSSNPYNVVQATLEALKLSANPRTIAARRGRKISDIVRRTNKEKAMDDAAAQNAAVDAVAEA